MLFLSDTFMGYVCEMGFRNNFFFFTAFLCSREHIVPRVKLGAM